jgi:hypothetical protein
MLAAVAAYLVTSLLVLRIEAKALASTENVPVVGWMTERVYLPLLRYAAVLTLLLIGYPEIFGIGNAPPLETLFEAGSGRFDLLINIGLVLCLALPLIPLVNQVPGIILTAQAILTACVILSWLAPQLGVEDPKYFMGWPVVLAVITLNFLAYLMGRALMALFPDTRRSPGPALIMDSMRLLAELPAVLIYTFALGRQL